MIFFFNFSYNRLEKIRKMRWEFGSVLPADIKYNLNEQEVCLTFLSLYDLTVLVYSHNRYLTEVQAFRFMVGLGHCPMISKYGPFTFQGSGPSGPILFSCENRKYM